MKKLLYITLFLFLLCLPVLASGTTYSYYFSNTPVGSQNCTLGNACAGTMGSGGTIRALVENADSGDTVNLYFDRGSSWTVDSYCSGSTPCLTGVWGLEIEDSDPIVNIDAYGAGDKPIFDGSVSDFSDGGIPSHDSENGPLEWSNLFRFKKDNCSLKNVEIKNMYGGAVSVGADDNPADYFTAEGNTIHNYGKNAFYASSYHGTQYSTFTKNLIYDGGQLYVQGKSLPYSWGIAISVAPWDGRSRSALGNTISYNVIYNISGEVIHGTGSTIEYNIIGDSGSIAIYVYGNKSDIKNTIVRYNLITMSDWGTSIYDQLSQVSPEGIVITDELDGGNNSGALIEIYGNTVINRNVGIGFWDYYAWDTYGEVRIYNNTVIDSHLYNYYVANFHTVAAGKGFVYNNASIFYDNPAGGTTAKHGFESGTGTFTTYWTVDTNAYWTTGAHTVDTDWDTNYVTTDPKLYGEDKAADPNNVNWDGLASGDPRGLVDFADIYPDSADSPLIGAGKTLTYDDDFLSDGAVFADLPATDSLSGTLLDQDIYGTAWEIGAFVYAATYYVDADAAGGGNGSVGTPWNTIAQVNAVDFADGDIIKFEKSDTFDDASITLAAVTNPATKTITIQAYGAGDLPWIKGAGTQGGIFINNNNQDGLSISLKDLNLDGQHFTADWAAIHLYDLKDITIDNIEADGSVGYVEGEQSRAISITNPTGDVEIKNCTIEHWGPDTLWDTPPTPSGAVDHEGIFIHGAITAGKTVSIHNNTIREIEGDGIQLEDVRASGGTIIYLNTLWNSGENNLDIKGCYYVSVYNNTIGRDATFTGTSGSSNGELTQPSVQILDFNHGYGSNDIEIHDNLIGPDDRVNIRIAASSTEVNNDINIHHNYFNAAKYHYLTYTSATNLKIHNNIWQH